MTDWRSPKAQLKKTLRGVVYRGAQLSGRLHMATPAQKAIDSAETVAFFGHRVGRPGGLAEHHETRLVFASDRPSYEEVKRLSYSPTGMGWAEGRLVEKYSVLPITLRDLAVRPPRTAETLATCAVVECDAAYSYGDWTHCFLGTILAADFPGVPVFIPHHLAQKEYVRRDLEQAGVRWITAESWVEIEQAYVLRKPNPLAYWSAREVAAYRAAFSIKPVTPVSGSITYMGRFDLKGELFMRCFPSREAAACVRAMGGKDINQADLNTSTSHLYAAHAETVIGDHGSGMLNILFWQPKTVIELVVDNSWVNNTLFVAAAMHVTNFAVLQVDGLSCDEITALIEACLTYFDSKTP